MMKLEKTDEYQDWFAGLADKIVKARIEDEFAALEKAMQGMPDLLAKV